MRTYFIYSLETWKEIMHPKIVFAIFYLEGLNFKFFYISIILILIIDWKLN